MDTPDEGPCNASGYETVANQLVSEGLVDPEKIGIIGFSRTCYHVMETLTFGSLHLRAASITDGVMVDYLQYMLFDRFPVEYDPIIGAKPSGEGLQQWLKRSPGFNLDKVTAPLLVVGEGPSSLLLMWQPYAGLRYLHKAVDLMMLNTDEHVLTNPAVRMASQGGSVDWFRFWLQDYEDPDPAKAEQYKRWRELRKLREREKEQANVPQGCLRITSFSKHWHLIGYQTAGTPEVTNAPTVVYLLLPVCISTHGLPIFTIRKGVDMLLIGGAGTLNSIDRRRQCSQFWSFVFHGFHLLSLLRLTYTAC